MNYEKKIAKIIENSRPGCGQTRECNTECGKCGAEKVVALFPEGLLKLLDDAKCPECEGSGDASGANFTGRFPTIGTIAREKCSACKGTGQRYEIGMFDPNAELPEMLESNYGIEPYSLNPYSYDAAQQDMLKAGYVKRVK